MCVGGDKCWNDRAVVFSVVGMLSRPELKRSPGGIRLWG